MRSSTCVAAHTFRALRQVMCCYACASSSRYCGSSRVIRCPAHALSAALLKMCCYATRCRYIYCSRVIRCPPQDVLLRHALPLYILLPAHALCAAYAILCTVCNWKIATLQAHHAHCCSSPEGQGKRANNDGFWVSPNRIKIATPVNSRTPSKTSQVSKLVKHRISVKRAFKVGR